MINKGIELNKAGINTPLAIETSGHAAFRENYFLDDGAYVIAKLLIALPQLMKEKRTLSDLIATLKQPPETHEVRFNIQQMMSVKQVWQSLKICQNLLKNGWLFIRPGK